MNVSEISAYIACVILAALAIFQLALILGAPLGKFAWGGAHTVLPSKLRVGSFVSIVLYSVFAVITLDKARLTDIVSDGGVVNIGIWALTAYFFVGVIVNSISRSKNERAVMTPVALALAILCLLVAAS